MELSESIVIDAPAGTVFAVYADVANWPAWDPDTRAASIAGPFAAGSCGRLAPARGLPVPMRLASVEPGRGFTVVAPVLFSTMVFTHTLRPAPAGTCVTHGVAFHGPFAWFLRRLVGPRIRAGLPLTMRRLKEYAEMRAHAGSTPASRALRPADQERK